MNTLTELKEQERILLLNILKNFKGEKCLFFEKSLHIILNVILSDEDINKEQFEHIFFLNNETELINTNKLNKIRNILFFIRPYFYEIEEIFKIVEKIEKGKITDKQYVFIFIPYMTHMCKEKILKNNVLDVSIKIILFPLYFIPIYNDVYSLEFKNLFKEYYVDNDFSNLIFCSFSLMFLQYLFNGVFKNIKSLGHLSQFISEQLIDLRKEIVASNFNIQVPNNFDDDFFDILSNIQNFQDLKYFKNSNEPTVVPTESVEHSGFIRSYNGGVKENEVETGEDHAAGKLHQDGLATRGHRQMRVKGEEAKHIEGEENEGEEDEEDEEEEEEDVEEADEEEADEEEADEEEADEEEADEEEADEEEADEEDEDEVDDDEVDDDEEDDDEEDEDDGVDEEEEEEKEDEDGEADADVVEVGKKKIEYEQNFKKACEENEYYKHKEGLKNRAQGKVKIKYIQEEEEEEEEDDNDSYNDKIDEDKGDDNDNNSSDKLDSWYGEKALIPVIKREQHISQMNSSGKEDKKEQIKMKGNLNIFDGNRDTASRNSNNDISNGNSYYTRNTSVDGVNYKKDYYEDRTNILSSRTEQKNFLEQEKKKELGEHYKPNEKRKELSKFEDNKYVYDNMRIYSERLSSSNKSYCAGITKEGSESKGIEKLKEKNMAHSRSPMMGKEKNPQEGETIGETIVVPEEQRKGRKQVGGKEKGKREERTKKKGRNLKGRKKEGSNVKGAIVEGNQEDANNKEDDGVGYAPNCADFMNKLDNTKFFLKKKDREKLEKEEKKEKNYLLERIGISDFNFLLNICDDIDSCIIIDRKMDMVTPFCTPFTYEGLLDHLFCIENLQIEIPRYIIFNDDQNPLRRKKDKNSAEDINSMKIRVKLKSSVDVLYNDIKDLNQNDVGTFLHKKASDIQRTYKEKDSLKDIKQINEYMRKFKEKHYEHNSVSTHVNIASFILSTIKKEHSYNKLKLEDEIIQLNTNTNKSALLTIAQKIQLLIYTNESIFEVYRILCLFCVITNGCNESYINGIKKDIIEQYGINELTRLNKLHLCNILKHQSKQKFVWNYLKNHFNLLSNEENDISYVCNGYAPLSVRLIEYMGVVKNNIQVFPEIFNLLNGPTLDIVQNAVGFDNILDIPKKINNKKKKKNVILFYVGGISYAEIASIRKLNKNNQNYNYLIFTTEIISSKKLLQSMNT
ncbi:vacuolar protein sorting-associated protein 33, putative (VPS33) [Plasmodium malariae]|uniref:Vacuolar protein sorting-associated protein 33, putative (VPS33) n=1 Tax=Plasmodium malariae TaxID=5858 RepID=A0A1A8VUK7_PLAMA|nr:vacuolar protein sorting-associated protein 33, putative (VPS33) [Plasmodium malariae]